MAKIIYSHPCGHTSEVTFDLKSKLVSRRYFPSNCSDCRNKHNRKDSQ